MYSARFDAKYDDSSRAQTETWLVIEKDGAEFLRTPSGFYSACSDQEDALVLAADALNVHEATGMTPSQLQARVAELEAAMERALQIGHTLNFELANGPTVDHNGRTADAVLEAYNGLRAVATSVGVWTK